jgi:hypothetical protein
MMNVLRCVVVLGMLCLGGGVAAAADQVPATTPLPKDGSCLHHTLADKNVVVKLANGEKYDDRYPKKEAVGANTRGMAMPLHTFLCTNGRVSMLQ